MIWPVPVPPGPRTSSASWPDFWRLFRTIYRPRLCPSSSLAAAWRRAAWTKAASHALQHQIRAFAIRFATVGPLSKLAENTHRLLPAGRHVVRDDWTTIRRGRMGQVATVVRTFVSFGQPRRLVGIVEGVCRWLVAAHA